MRSETLRELLHSLQRGGISDPAVLDAMRRTPRENFISERSLKSHAYEDEALPIECEQTISQPFIVGYMTERLHVTPNHDVLEIGTGSGYQTAILARLARHVYTIECHRELHNLAVNRFEELGLENITAIQGDGTRGWPSARTFERILVTAGTNAVPDALIEQLAPCGAIVIPLGPREDQRITLITHGRAGEEYQTLLPVRFVPLLSRMVDRAS